MRAVSATVLASLSLQPRLSAVQPANSKNSATGNSSPPRRPSQRQHTDQHAEPEQPPDRQPLLLAHDDVIRAPRSA